MTQTKVRAWARFSSGRRLDFINSDPSAWLDSDLISRPARTYRWGGKSSWPLPLPVTQHSLLVFVLHRLWSNTPLLASNALLEPLHDAEEGFFGFDCIFLLKGVLSLPFRTVSFRLMAVVPEWYELCAWPSTAHAVHKRADPVAAAFEAVYCTGWATHEVHDALGTARPVFDVDPLAEIYGCRPWKLWVVDVAAERSLGTLGSLRTAVHGQIEAQV